MIALFAVLSAGAVFAQTDLSTTGGGIVPACPSTGCSFPEFMLLIKSVIDFLLFKISIPLSALCFTYAGFMYLTTAVSDQKSKAKRIFINVLIGLIIAFAAWLIVKFVLVSLGYNANGGDFPTFYNPS